ncbi:SNF7 family protein [Zea mays]|uniref:SNF7 family protein n=1 Tax=Zea mays TaxID=4577 RepID=A0A1D6MR84_MAIZE|nr:SNF7 family protein [Zea mays]
MLLPGLPRGISWCRLPAASAGAHENRTSLDCDHAVLWSVNTGAILGPLADCRTVDSTRVLVVTLDTLSVPVCGGGGLCRLARTKAAGLEKREKFINPSPPLSGRGFLVAANSDCGSGLLPGPGTGMRGASFEGSGPLLVVATGVLLLCWTGGGRGLRFVSAAAAANAAAWSSEKKSGL